MPIRTVSSPVRNILGLSREAARMFHSVMREKPGAAGGQLGIMGVPEMLANPARWLIPAMVFAGAALYYFGYRTPPRPVTEQSRPQAILASEIGRAHV